MLPYFKRAEHNERGADAWHGSGGPLNVRDLLSPNRHSADFVAACREAGLEENPDFNGARQEGAGLYQVTHKDGERWSVAKGYLTPSRGRANLTVVTSARARRIVFASAPCRYSTPVARLPSNRMRVACAPVMTCRLGRARFGAR